jgi:hypothetical protein
MSVKYYLAVGHTKLGPFTRAELDQQGVGRETLIWFKGLPDWVAAGQVPELTGIFEEPPPIPGTRAAAAPPVERPPLPERDLDPGSEQFKDPAVNLPRMELPPPRPEYPEERDDRDEPPPRIAALRIPYDRVGLHRLYLGGMIVYVPGVLLLLMFAIGLGLAGLYGFEMDTPRFDPQRRDIVHDFNPAARGDQTLAAICLMTAAVVGFLCTASGMACFAVMLYRAWVVVQDGRARTSPGRAVGFLFIPFFHLFWVWVGIWGLSRALNRFVRRYDLDAPAASQPLGFAVSLYSNLTYFPFPFAGLVPLKLNLILLPFFMRSVYRTVAAICEDANQDRLTSAPVDLRLREPALTRPVSAHILSIVAMALTPIAVGMMVPGYCLSLDSLRDLRRDARALEVHRQAIDHLRGLNPPDVNRLVNFERRASQLESQLNGHRRQNLIISICVFVGGALLLAIALTLAYVSKVCARPGDEAPAQGLSGWPATQGAG